MSNESIGQADSKNRSGLQNEGHTAAPWLQPSGCNNPVLSVMIHHSRTCSMWGTFQLIPAIAVVVIWHINRPAHNSIYNECQTHKRFGTTMKTGSSRRLKRYPTTSKWVSSWLPFIVDLGLSWFILILSKGKLTWHSHTYRFISFEFSICSDHRFQILGLCPETWIMAPVSRSEPRRLVS